MANPPQGSRGAVARIQRWYQVDVDDVDGPLPPPAAAAVATVAQRAALWPEQPGQERSLAQVWFRPDDANEPAQFTRLWLADENAWTQPPPDASWEDTGITGGTGSNTWRRHARAVRGGVTGSLGARTRAGTGVSGDDVLLMQHVSPPLLGAQTIAGSFRSVGMVAETSAADDYRSQIVVRVVSNDGGTVRGILYAGDPGALVTEWATSDTIRRFPQSPGALASVAAQDGDRIIIERGFHSHSTSVANAHISGSGSPATAADLLDDETDNTGGVQWIEFTGTIRFQSELTADTLYDAQPFVSNAQTWFAPDSGVEAPSFAPSAYDPSVMAGAWQESQQDRSNQPVWFHPADAFEGLTPPVVATGPTVDQLAALFGSDGSGQLDRALQPVWFQPDTEVLGTTTGTVTTATVAQQAGLWQDQSAQQDRGIQPTWFVPPDATEAQYPTLPIPPFNVATQGAGLWMEQPGQERGIGPTWYSAAVEPVDGPLQSWLFTVGAPGTGTGTAPAVLIDAEDGDVYLYIGGNFIVSADKP